jgi:DmsE family decaheme c-type cytochrome
MLIDNSVNDNCYRCHAEKRGPVLFEHPPVKENCLNCHSPHGSMHESMLVAKQPRLCHNCHINSRHPSEPRVATNRFVFNKSCVNCHSEVHGSNHPGGVRQIR